MSDAILTTKALSEIEAHQKSDLEYLAAVNSAPTQPIRDRRDLLASHKAQAEKIERLEKLVYVPGLWRCAKCNFILTKRNLNSADGTVTDRDTPGDKCPNCASPLWRVSERDERREMDKRAEELFARATAAEAKVAALEKALEEIRDHSANQDMNHKDFRVAAYHAADAALGA